MRSTHQRNIIFESPFLQAKEVLLEPVKFPLLEELSTAIYQLLRDLDTWSFIHVNPSRNLPASLNVESVTKDNRTQSYVALGGP